MTPSGTAYRTDARTLVPVGTPPAERLVVLAVNQREHGATARWLTRWLAPDDRVHVVNVYEPIDIAGCTWEPVARAARARAVEAEMIVSRNEAPLRSAHVAAEVSGSAIPGEPVTVLVKLSAIVDVLVLGADACGAEVCHRTLKAAACPTVVVPAGYVGRSEETVEAAAVTVLLPVTERPSSVLAFAAAEAARLGVPLREVDAGEGESPLRSVDRATRHSRLLVTVPRYSPFLQQYGGLEQCPVVFVPDPRG